MLIPSLTYGVALGVPNSRSLFVSFSVNDSCGYPSQCSRKLPRSACDVSIVTVFSSGFCRKEGLGWSGHQVQVLRNQKIGNTCSLAGSGPRLATLIWIIMSVGVAFAYSTNTSK